MPFNGSTHDPYREVDRQRGFSDVFKRVVQLPQYKWWTILVQKIVHNADPVANFMPYILNTDFYQSNNSFFY